MIFCFQTILTLNEIWNWFWCELGPILARFFRSWSILGRLGGILGPSLGCPLPPRCIHKRLEFFERFWHRFFDNFSVILGAILSPAGTKMAPKIGQKFDQGGLPGRFLGLTMYPNSSLEASAMIFWRFLTVLYRFFVNLLLIFGRILDEFGGLFQGVLLDFSRFSIGVSCRYFFDSYYPYLYVISYKQKQTWNV